MRYERKNGIFSDGNVNISINANSVSGLATVATSGAYSDLSGKPSLATVATSGSYNDLSNKPTISTGKVTQKFNQTFNVNSGGTTKTITGLTAYKPVYIVIASSTGACNLRLSGGFLYNDSNGSYSNSSYRLSIGTNIANWVSCIPNGTSISLVGYSNGKDYTQSFSLAVYQ